MRLLIICLILIISSCENVPSKPSEVKQEKMISENQLISLIDQHSKKSIFMDFWLGMSQNEFDAVCKYLKGHRKLKQKGNGRYTYSFIIEHSTGFKDEIPVSLYPSFDNNNLAALRLVLFATEKCPSALKYPGQSNVSYSNNSRSCISTYKLFELKNIYKSKYGASKEIPAADLINVINPEFTNYVEFKLAHYVIRIKENKTIIKSFKSIGDSIYKPEKGKPSGSFYEKFEIVYASPDYFNKADQNIRDKFLEKEAKRENKHQELLDDI